MPIVLEALDYSPVVLVEGPRQAGKTVLARDLVGPRHTGRYITLDDALVLASAKADPQGFVLGLDGPTVIDEVQRAPEIFLPMKLAVDADRRPGRFLLTGSADIMLLPRVSESLVGRLRLVTLWPFSQCEIEESEPRFVEVVSADGPLPIVSASESREDVVERAIVGGFPEVTSLPSGRPRDGWFRSYVTTLLERDAREVLAVSDRVGLPRLLSVLAARSGTLVNVSDLARALGMARATVDRYLRVLEKVFVVRLIPPWAADSARRLMRSPKILVTDSGLAAHLAGIDMNRTLEEPDAVGRLLETFVGCELLRLLSSTAADASLLHFRDAKGNEVDWVLEDRSGRVVGIEVKASATLGASDTRGLKALAHAAGPRFHRGIVLHLGSTTVPLGDRIWAMPIEGLWRISQKR
ncbi:MAG: ATP-binding protein [Coriobacteriia bacterium]|nr:ATP-binding protein [Coriobacteriia bacterium]